MDSYFPDVAQAVAGEGRTVYAYFTDGSIHLYDMQPLIDRGGIFAQLADDSFFHDRLTVLNNTIAWDLSGNYDPTDCIDIDPFDVYAAPVVSDPLEETA